MTDEWTTTYTVNVGDGETVEMTGNLDRLDEITDLMKAHAADGWTHITGDPTTLPENGVDTIAAWVNAAPITKSEIIMVKSRHYTNGGWYNKEDGWWMSDAWWRVYAWRPWPTPPPIEASE